MATKAKEDKRKFILECIEVYHSLPALWSVKKTTEWKKMNNMNICFTNIVSWKEILELSLEKETLRKNQEDLLASCYCRN